MYTIQENLKPLQKQYNRFLNGAFLSDLLQFKGQKGVGNSYVSKVLRSQSVQIYSQYEHVMRNVNSPSYVSFISDNFIRIFALNAVERLIVAYQSIPGMIRRGRPNSMSFLFTEIMNDGAFRGTMRGASLSAIQTSCVLWPSVLLTNQQKAGLWGFMGTYIALDALLHPLDTIKNFVYSKTIEPTGIKTALSSLKLRQLYSGVLSKMLFNIPFTAAIYSTTQNDEYSWAYWVATALAYPLLARKVLDQTSEIVQPNKFSYRGVVPYMVLNYLFCWKLTALFSEQRQKQTYMDAERTSVEKLGHL